MEIRFNPCPAVQGVTPSPSGRRRSSHGLSAFRSRHDSQKQRKLQEDLNSFVSENPPETGDRMSTEAFASFLTKSQGRNEVEMEEAVEIITKYDTFSEENSDEYITLKGFTHYMLSQESNPPRHIKLKLSREKLDKPLSNYFIASSHNTYLTGHQLHGDSSVAMYAKVSYSKEAPLSHLAS